VTVPAILVGAAAALAALGMLLAVFVPERRLRLVLGTSAVPASLLLLVGGAWALLGGGSASVRLWSLPTLGTLVLRLDPLSALFLAVTGLVYACGSVYASGSAASAAPEHRRRLFTGGYLALFLAVVLVYCAGDIVSLLLAWEAMALLIYGLVVLGRGREEAAEPALHMMLVSEVGTLGAVLALAALAAHADATDFASIRAAGASLPTWLGWAIFVLALLGFGVKAGLVPVGNWLPPAYRSSPRALAPVLAGATLNLGLYGIVRVGADLLPALGSGPGIVALLLGALTAVLGILYATTDRDLKSVLAHSSVENAGIVVTGLGAGLVFRASGLPVLAAMAFVAALFHMTNHSLYKTLLFVGAGAVEDSAGTRQLDELGGMARGLPWLSALFLAGSLAVAAIPPFNGFGSEWLTLQAILRSVRIASPGVRLAFIGAGALLALAAGLAVTCFVRLFAMTFLGAARSPRAAAPGAVGRSPVVAMAVLAVACLALGLGPTYAIQGLDGAASRLAGGAATGALVPAFFAPPGSPLAPPPAFGRDFHELGADVGRGVVPGRGVAIVHRNAETGTVVFATSPSYGIVALLILLAAVFGVAWALSRGRKAVRVKTWAGGLAHLWPDYTYTATAFARPVQVVFDAVFRPREAEEVHRTQGERFRTAIVRRRREVHVVDRWVLRPLRSAAEWVAARVADLHHGRLNAYVAYVLLALVVVLAMVWVM